MTIQSFTSEREYETTLDTCNCPDHIYRHRTCKHMEALHIAYARARRAAFNELCYTYDYRSQARATALVPARELAPLNNRNEGFKLLR